MVVVISLLLKIIVWTEIGVLALLELSRWESCNLSCFHNTHKQENERKVHTHQPTPIHQDLLSGCNVSSNRSFSNCCADPSQQFEKEREQISVKLQYFKYILLLLTHFNLSRIFHAGLFDLHNNQKGVLSFSWQYQPKALLYWIAQMFLIIDPPEKRDYAIAEFQ